MMSTSYDNASSNPQGSTVDSNGSIEMSDYKAVVVGLYGLPGSGKTSLLNQLEQELGQTDFSFYEGSKMIDDIVPGGLDAFHRMDEHKKADWRDVLSTRLERSPLTAEKLRLSLDISCFGQKSRKLHSQSVPQITWRSLRTFCTWTPLPD